MRKRSLFSLACLVALLALTTVMRQTHSQARFHPENVCKIKEGMTEQEVETLLGAPPGNYRRPRHSTGSSMSHHSLKLLRLEGDTAVREWLGEDDGLYVSVLIRLDDQGKVVEIQSLRLAPRNVFWLDELRSRLPF
jgi:hypothetical protein